MVGVRKSHSSGKLIESLKFTEGGLVVYGGMVGGLIATGVWCYLRGKSYLMLADIVTPAFLLGLALGRVGCLLNGCCYGAVCYQELPAVHFPPGSPPYMDQGESGLLIGAKLAPGPKIRTFVVKEVEENGWAAERSLKAGDVVSFESYPNLEYPASSPKVVIVTEKDGPVQRHELPLQSLPVHPSQLYATVNAGLLSGLLATITLVYSRRGFIFGLGLVMYGFSRILEEFIRVDEAGQFGTVFSIGQWVSFLGIVVGVVLIGVSILRQKRKRQLAPISL